jgi:hypothetical protein
MKTVTYLPNMERWKKHFISMADGKALSWSQRGKGSVGSRFTKMRTSRQLLTLDQIGKGISSLPPTIKYVSPVEQVVDQAKSDMKRDGPDQHHKKPIKGKPKIKATSLSHKRPTHQKQQIRRDIFGRYSK